MHFKCSFIIHYSLMPAIEGLFNKKQTHKITNKEGYEDPEIQRGGECAHPENMTVCVFDLASPLLLHSLDSSV